MSKRNGNEEQVTFNEKVEEVLVDTKAELSTVGSLPALERAREAIEKGVWLPTEWQKLIKIADRLEFGWGVVAEYTAEELAEDSDYEKRPSKAEKAKGEEKEKAGRAALQSHQEPTICAVGCTFVPALCSFDCSVPAEAAGCTHPAAFPAMRGRTLLRLCRDGARSCLLPEDGCGRTEEVVSFVHCCTKACCLLW